MYPQRDFPVVGWFEERKSHDVVVVIVTQKDICTLQSGFGEQITAWPESGSSIKDDGLLTALDFDTAGIATVNSVIGSWTR